MKPINQSERKSAKIKFSFFLVLSCLLIFLPFFFYRFVPERAVQDAVTEVVEEEDTVDAAQVAALQQKLSALAESMNQVNIMFLVDATQGMEPHLPAVAQAAQRIEAQYPAQMMAACYRDAAEGAWLYMDNNMVNEDPATWLNDLDTRKRFDKDEPEAMFYGLKQALESEDLPPNENNILILVGDAGNHAQESKTDIPPGDIVELLKAKNCHFAAFQVRNPNTDPTYASFATQMVDGILEPLKNGFSEASFEEKDDVDSYGLSYTLTGTTKNLLYITSPSKALPPDQLTAKIYTFVEQVFSNLEQQRSQIQALAAGENPSPLAPEVVNLLAQHQITEEQLTILSQ